MSNYKKDKGYIKQRLEYVSPIDYISKLEEKTEYLEYLKNENERLNNIIDKALEYLLNNKLYTFKYDDEELFEITTDKKAKDDLLKILGGEK